MYWLMLLFFICTSSLGFCADQALQHVEQYRQGIDITGWAMSEKLDGIRGYWTGKKLLTRSGNIIHTPPWFIKNFPPFPLDGELWRRRNDFPFVQKTVLDTTPTKEWQQITYNIFEVPGASGNFQERLHMLNTWLQHHPLQHLRVIEQVPCRGSKHLAQFLKQVEALGGEGVIVKDPTIAFASGVNQVVLKVKSFQTMEGVVIGYNPGKGKFKQMLGSLTLRLENGTLLKLGSGFSIPERKMPPPLGSIVVFKYQGMTANGIPRFASYLHMRKD
nr:DNA ligase [uncultured Desulfobulbus sp.]